MKVLAQIPGTDETIMVQGEVQPVLLLLSEQDIHTIRTMPDENRWYLQHPADHDREALKNWVGEVQEWLGQMEAAQGLDEATKQLDGLESNIERAAAQTGA
jgi:hypothetical protein